MLTAAWCEEVKEVLVTMFIGKGGDKKMLATTCLEGASQALGIWSGSKDSVVVW